jgi:hypothetical protein
MERFVAAPQTAHVTRCLITDLDKCATFRPEKTTCPVTALIRSWVPGANRLRCSILKLGSHLEGLVLPASPL